MVIHSFLIPKLMMMESLLNYIANSTGLFWISHWSPLKKMTKSWRTVFFQSMMGKMVLALAGSFQQMKRAEKVHLKMPRLLLKFRLMPITSRVEQIWLKSIVHKLCIARNRVVLGQRLSKSRSISDMKLSISGSI